MEGREGGREGGRESRAGPGGLAPRAFGPVWLSGCSSVRCARLVWSSAQVGSLGLETMSRRALGSGTRPFSAVWLGLTPPAGPSVLQAWSQHFRAAHCRGLPQLGIDALTHDARLCDPPGAAICIYIYVCVCICICICIMTLSRAQALELRNTTVVCGPDPADADPADPPVWDAVENATAPRAWFGRCRPQRRRRREGFGPEGPPRAPRRTVFFHSVFQRFGSF